MSKPRRPEQLESALALLLPVQLGVYAALQECFPLEAFCYWENRSGRVVGYVSPPRTGLLVCDTRTREECFVPARLAKSLGKKK